MAAKPIMALVVETLDGRLLDRAVHALSLTVGPGMVGLGQTVLDAVSPTHPVERVPPKACRGAASVPGKVGKLDTVIGQHRVDFVGNGCHQVIQECRRRLGVGALCHSGKGELRGPVDGDEQIEFALGGAQVGDVDVEIADGVALEALLFGFVGADLRQAAAAMAPQAAMG